MLSRLPLIGLSAALISAPVSHASGIEAIAVAHLDAELSFTIPGKVVAVLVEPGDLVKAGDPLVRLDDEQALIQLEILRIRAESSLEIQAAEAEWKMSQTDEIRVKRAHAGAAAADFEVERAALATLRDKLAYELSQQNQIEAHQRYQQAQVQHAQYTIRAPADGVVESIDLEVGESVDALAPVVRVVAANPLVIDVPAPTAVTLSLEDGNDAWVTFTLPGLESSPVRGRITHVAAVADPASGTRIVRVETPNPEGLPAGVPVSVSFQPNAGATSLTFERDHE